MENSLEMMKKNINSESNLIIVENRINFYSDNEESDEYDSSVRKS
jgi:hypothetical protein